MSPVRSIVMSLALVLAAATHGHSQSKFGIGLSGMAAIPVSGETDGAAARDLTELVATGWGGQIHFRYHLTDNVRLGLNGGIFAHELDADEESTLEFVPITLSADYSFTESPFRPYVGLETGVFLTTLRNQQQFNLNGTATREDGDTESFFGFAPVIGGRAALGDKLEVDVNLKYYFIFISDSDQLDDITAGILPISIGLNYRF